MKTGCTLALLILFCLETSAILLGQQQQLEPPLCSNGEKGSSPKPTYTPEPPPPESWVGKKKTALVVVEIDLDKKGKVSNASVVSSEDDDARETTLEAVKRWRFKPAKCGKEPMESHLTVNVRTTLY